VQAERDHRKLSPRAVSAWASVGMLLALVCAALAVGAPIAAAAPLGSVTEFSTGLNAGAEPFSIALGGD